MEMANYTSGAIESVNYVTHNEATFVAKQGGTTKDSVVLAYFLQAEYFL